MIGNLLSFVAFWVITFVASVALVLFLKPSGVDGGNLVMELVRVFSSELLVAAVFMSAGFMVSSVLRSAKQASPVALALVFLTYILGIMAGLNDKVDFFQYFSPINYAIPSEIMDKGITGTNALISCGVIVVMVAMTFVLYKKKDLKV